jgi:Rrf2 family transcriptional regulator, iron-sulfur cluster assembly transcription factor
VIYSSACEYAIRAASYLASRYEEDGSLIKLRDIAEAEGLPPPFLSSILQRLVMAGLLRSARGPTGGYGLEAPPDRISLFDIKAAVDGTAELEACAVGLERCSDEMPCPLHDTWKPIRQEIKRYLETTTLKDMAAAVEKKGTVGASGGGSGKRRNRAL